MDRVSPHPSQTPSTPREYSIPATPHALVLLNRSKNNLERIVDKIVFKVRTCEVRRFLPVAAQRRVCSPR